jgi:RHS repeat-associated protein
MTCSLPPASLSTRGFTNQEQMADVCLDNYNARIYDPQIGRFMSADTEIPDTHNTQSYNRYTYVENGPLSYEDPTGNVGFRLTGPTMGVTVETWTITTGPYSQFSIRIVTDADDGLVWINSTQTGITGGVGSVPAGLDNSSSGSQGSTVVTTPATSSATGAPDSGTNLIAHNPGEQVAQLIAAAYRGNQLTSVHDDQNDVDVTALTNVRGVVDISQYSDRPKGSVLGTSTEDAWAQDLAAHTYISPSLPASEVVDGLQKDGSTVQGQSQGNSMATVPPGSVAVFHDHPLEDLGGSAAQHLGMNNQPWRLGFGQGDDAPLVKYGAPNYMLNYERKLQVLEYTPEHGYATRDLGNIRYVGDGR